MATFTASTPSPPPGSIRTPPTPKHGFCDPWEPYSPRKSARLSSQRTANRTPSPQSTHRHRTPPRTARKAVASSSSIMSPTASPQKKRFPPLDSNRRSSGSLTTQSTTNAASALGLDKSQQQPDQLSTASITHRSGMLPTPVKTPRKAPTETQAASIQSVARNLFANDEATASPRKKRTPKKYTGLSMESFKAETVEDPIEIYTDSQDRVPQLDRSADNPFYGSHTVVQPEPSKRRSKRKVAVPGEGAQSVDDALQREDGMVYVFRGKKVFRKFAQGEDDGEPSTSTTLSRSSIKPRRLFQTQQQEELHVTSEDEEAMTDIEDHAIETELAEDSPQTPIEEEDPCPTTPSAPKFGPVATPPETRRTTRFGPKAAEATPSKPRSRQLSPGTERALKRPGDTVLAASAPKRTRA